MARVKKTKRAKKPKGCPHCFHCHQKKLMEIIRKAISDSRKKPLKQRKTAAVPPSEPYEDPFRGCSCAWRHNVHCSYLPCECDCHDALSGWRPKPYWQQ